MNEDTVVMTLFSPAKSLWDQILNEIEQEFVIKEVFTTTYNNKNCSFEKYFSEFYGIQSQSSKADLRIKKKGKIIENFGTEMLVISVLCSAREKIIKFKKRIREKYKELLSDIQVVEKNPFDVSDRILISFFDLVPDKITTVSTWMIIHTFEKGVMSMQAIDFIKKNCKTVMRCK